ncbi:putative bifunctional diguanylate cyclase/phosphodiesterase [Planococcus sp. X10-3]|uniref:putative bifunctional diguanylate cyclase/phosphodiesterase n=1 Tax=Planococcus sp. X10-3 TaxID=3061240 RepID=UPI003BB06CC9
MTDSKRPTTEHKHEMAGTYTSEVSKANSSIFDLLVKKVPVSMYIMSEDKFVYVNESLCELLGYLEDQFLLGDVRLKDVIYPEDLSIVQTRIYEQSETAGGSVRYRVRIIRHDGSLLHAELHSKIAEWKGKPAFIGSVTDVTEEVVAQSRLKDSEERYNSLFFENPDAIFSFDTEGNFTNVNPGALALSGYSYDELMKMSFVPMIVPEHLDKALHYFSDALKGNTNRYEVNLYGKNGKLIQLEVTNFPMNQAGQITGAYGIAKDITSRNEHKQLLEEMAFFDHLTKLPNRKLFEDRLEQAYKISNEKEGELAVLFLNLDRFKYINDSLGYEYGDVYLKKIAFRMVECVADSATVGRFAGDEFAILLPNAGKEAAIESAKRLNEVFAEPMEVLGHQLALTASIGIACASKMQQDLIKQAESAMLYTKKHSKNSYSLYSYKLNQETADKLAIERELKSAIRNDEFLIHYQPIINLKTGQRSAMEALIRWNHPELGMVPPDHFIPISEESGQIVEIGKWVLYTACSQNKSWQLSGYAPFRICVNISTIQLQHPNFVRLVKSVLEETGLEAKWLELEVTESILLEDTEVLKDSLRKLKALGISMSIDDFGTGFTSLNYLRQFSFDRVKIDRSFVQDINNDLNGKAITSTVITLAHKLGMEVVAEGIEDAVQLAYLHEELCDEGQGYYFCHPKAADQHDLLPTNKT